MPRLDTIKSDDLIAIVGARQAKQILAQIEAAYAAPLTPEVLTTFINFVNGQKLSTGEWQRIPRALEAYLRDHPSTPGAMRRWAEEILEGTG